MHKFAGAVETNRQAAAAPTLEARACFVKDEIELRHLTVRQIVGVQERAEM
jgi:hypothetical protein